MLGSLNDRINEIIARRMDKGEMFYMESYVSSNPFVLKKIPNFHYYSKFSKELQDRIRENVMAEKKEIEGKDVRIKEILTRVGTITSLSNFFKYYRDGIFNNEKLDFLREFSQSLPDGKFFPDLNFGICKDDIFSLNKDFLKYALPFCNITYKLTSISNANPRLLKMIVDRINSYDDFKENLTEINSIIQFSAVICYDLQGKVEEIQISDLIDGAYRRKNFMNRFGTDLDNLDNLSEEAKTLFMRIKETLQWSERDFDDNFNSIEPSVS